MSRKFSRRKETKPRSQQVINEIECSAHRIYLETGGEDIDFLVDAAKVTVEIARKRCAADQNEDGQDPLKLVLSAIRELRLAEAMREKKLKLCHELVAEGKQAELEAAEIEVAAGAPQKHPQPPPSPQPPLEPAIESPESRSDQTGT